jgi:hypothetical protein
MRAFKNARNYGARPRGLVLAGGLLLALGLSSACTARYSQSLAGAIPDDKGPTVSSMSKGLSILGIKKEEPKAAHEQALALLQGCRRLTAVEVDYREKFYFVVSKPQISLKGTCVK